MIQKAQFHVPEHIVVGLVGGTMRRTGGVIRHAPGHADGGQILAHLRETTASPLSPDLLVGGASQIASMMNLAGAVASVVNLGATVAFGMATLSKLGDIEQKLDAFGRRFDDVEARLARLQWTVDLGFSWTLSALDRLESIAETGIEANLRAATQGAASVFDWPPEDPRRNQRLETCQGQANAAKHHLLLLAEKDVRELEGRWTRRATSRLQLQSEDVRTIARLRQASGACAVHAAILAEQGDMQAAARNLDGEAAVLRRQLELIGQLLLGHGDDRRFDQFLTASAREAGVDARRLTLWAQRFDPDCGSLESLVTWLQDQGTLGAAGGRPGWRAPTPELLPQFSDGVDGLWEDLDRLEGRVAEYSELAKDGVSSNEHRERLRLDEIPDVPGLAVFSSGRAGEVSRGVSAAG